MIDPLDLQAALAIVNLTALAGHAWLYKLGRPLAKADLVKTMCFDCSETSGPLRVSVALVKAKAHRGAHKGHKVMVVEA